MTVTKLLFMQEDRDPHDIVVPLIEANRDGVVRQGPFFRGTGFFVGDGTHLVTVEHVLRQVKGHLAIMLRNRPESPYRLVPVRVDHEHDLAILRVDGYKSPTGIPLPASGFSVCYNVPVFTFEYGTTRQGQWGVQFEPATRLGNITRLRQMRDTHGPAGDNMLELSFPALRGASGAPVIDQTTCLLNGILVGNVGYELLPAQVDSVHREDGSVEEEVKYYLPQGLAVHAEHLIQLGQGVIC